MMAYAARSPVFNALEVEGNELTGGAFNADGGDQALLCQRCHSPIGIARGELPTFEEAADRPSREFLGEVALHGLSCDFCHQVVHADLEASPLGDGIANASFLLAASDVKYGPFGDAIVSARHQTAKSDYLRSSQFCGTCHDVRLQGEDARTGEPFLRLENAFTEWQGGPYATTTNPFGRVVTCQDCHMSMYPYEPPGTYPTDTAVDIEGAPLREVSTHYFTGVDIAFIDGFPGQDSAGLDTHGLPIGQKDRRRDLLRSACDFELTVPASVAPGEMLSLTVDVTNVGAGHNVPTGFSQERQMWIELIVTDATGRMLYESGYLVDSAHPETGEHAADGNLEDEDLQNLVGTLDPETLEADLEHGSDHNERPEANRGLMNFGNEFMRVNAEGEAEEVFSPFLANHMNNGHSIAPLAKVAVPYDIDVPADAGFPIDVRARLRFRPFPPRFLRALAQARPELVNEAIVDKNRIIDMAEAQTEIPQRTP